MIQDYDNFEVDGEWWFPGKPKCRGNLTFSQKKGGKLSTKGLLGQDIEDFSERMGEADLIILGKTDDAQALTLIECTRHGFRMNGDGSYGASFGVRYILSNGHFGQEKALAFKTIFVNVPRLNHWHGLTGYGTPDIQGMDGKSPFVYKREYKKPETRLFDIGDGKKVCLTFSANYKFNPEPDEVPLKETYGIRFESDKALELEELLNRILRVIDLISVCAQRVVRFSSIQLSVKLPDEAKPEDTLKLAWQHNYWDEGSKELDSYYVLLPFEPIASDFQIILKRWFEMCDEHEPSLEILRIEIHRRLGLSIPSFLSLCQAVESFHRGGSDKKPMSSSKFKELKKQIIEHTPEEHVEWLMGKLQYLNQPTLRERLTELLATQGLEIVGPFLGNDVSEFVGKVVLSRNYYTHLDPKRKKQAISEDELYLYSARLRLILSLLLLHKAGVETPMLRAAMDQRGYRVFGRLKQ